MSNITPVNGNNALQTSGEVEFSNEVMFAARNVAARDLNDAEFFVFIETCKRHNLNPLLKEVWGIRMGGRPLIMVSHDGYLKIANSNPDFDGMEADVVHANDSFRKRPDGSGFDHVYEVKDRGEIVGAYAVVHRKSIKYPLCFFAPMRDYDKQCGTWKQYPHAMILKVAENMAIKRAFSLSGLVSREEIDSGELLEEERMPSVKESEPIRAEDVTDFERKSMIKRKNDIWYKYLERAGGDSEQAKQLVFEVIGPLPSKDWTRDDLDKLENALTNADSIEPEMVEEKPAEPENCAEKCDVEPESDAENVASAEPEKKVRKSRKKE